MYPKYKFNWYLPIDHEQEVRAHMEKKESKHIISWFAAEYQKNILFSF